MQIIPQVPSLDALFRKSRVNTKSPLSNGSTTTEIDLEHYSKTSRMNPCLSVPRSRILEASQRATGRFVRGCVSLLSEQFRLLLFIVLRQGMRRLVCHPLYSVLKMWKSLTQTDQRLGISLGTAAEENLDFVNSRYNENYEQMKKARNKN